MPGGSESPVAKVASNDRSFCNCKELSSAGLLLSDKNSKMYVCVYGEECWFKKSKMYECVCGEECLFKNSRMNECVTYIDI